MSDPHTPDEQPDLPHEGLALGAGEHDTGLGPSADDELPAPRDALVAFRKSGGMRFTSRAIVVYRNGWVVPIEGTEGARPRHLGAEAMARLSRLVLRSGLARHRPAGVLQPPDRYAYAIVAYVGRSLRRAAAVDGAIPADLAPLIAALSRLLP
jgi:hypothetical protein